MLDGFGIDAGGVQADAGADAARVCCPSLECRFIIDGIDALCGSPEGCCDMLGLDEGDGPSGETVGGEESKRVGRGEVESEPALDDTRECGDSAEDRSVGCADEELLFAFAFVLLFPPADGCGGYVRDVGEGMGEFKWAASVAVEDDVVDGEGDGVAIGGEGDLGECVDMIMLSPLR